MKSNVEQMPYLRSMNNAKKIARAKIQNSSSNYQMLLKERNRLIEKGKEYLYRSKIAENEALYEKAQTFIAKANQINEKMLNAYQSYKEAEVKMAKLVR